MQVYTRKTILMGLMAGSMLYAFSREAQPPKVTTAPWAFKVEWVRPVSQEDTKVLYMLVQQNIADPNVIMTFYARTARLRANTNSVDCRRPPFGHPR